MKRALILALLLAGAAVPAASFAATPSQAATAAVDPAAKPLVDAYVAWRGGAAFEAMTSVHETGALETAGLKGAWQRWASRDGRDHDVYDLGGAFTGAAALLPNGSWNQDQGVVEDMPAASVDDGRRELAMEFGDAMRGRGGASVTRLADETRDGRTWAVLRIGFGDADTYDALIDAKTGELLGWKVVENRRERFMHMGDWRMVDGVRMAFLSEELHANPGENVVQRLDAVEINRPLDAALFARPQTRKMAVFAGGKAGTDPVPFDFFNANRIYIPATVNGRPVKVLLDSGADSTVVDKAFAEAAGIKSEAKAVANGTGGQQEAGLVRNVKVEVGAMTLTSPTAAIIDLADVSKRLGMRLDVVLGAEVFKQLVVDIDFKAHTIAFHQPDGFTPPAGAVMVPVTATGGVPTVPASIEGGPEVQWDFDIGNGSPLLVYPAYWQKHGMVDGRTTSKTMGGAVGGQRPEILGTTRSLTFAGITFKDVPTTFTTPGASGVDADRAQGNIGLPVYSRFRLITDYPHSRLWLVPNAQDVAAPFRHDRSGLRLKVEGQGLKVDVVNSGSPAEAAGWKVGEVITAIDGQAVTSSYPGSDLSRWSVGDAGRAVKLTTADGRVRTLVLKDYY
jgi:hypothetical protein